jgi:predicted AlkP superfamily pyrophosphatase or phosphodiesterase
MKLLPLITSLAAALLAACSSLPTVPMAAAELDTVVLLSIDGLNVSALGQGNSPHLDRIASEGVQARWMSPSYPSITFPNHYTMVTGLRPDGHGIVHNQIEDAELGRFELKDAQAVSNAAWWSDGIPLWVQASRAGLRTATWAYPGGDAPIGGRQADLHQTYDESVALPERMRGMLAWLALPQRPHLLVGYFEQVDQAGHYYGPNSPQYASALRKVDAAVGMLVEGLRERGQLARTNLIVVSDHGMAEVPSGQVIATEDMVAADVAHAVSVGQSVGFEPLPGQHAAASKALLGAHPNYDCWPREKLPAHWHYGSHRRVPAIICQMHEGWDANTAAVLARRNPGTRGSHGYEITLPSMRAVFIGQGPAFRARTRIEPINNVDIYPLVNHLLGLELPANDGDLQALVPALR